MNNYKPFLDRIDAQQDAMVRALKGLCRINSGTHNLSGLAQTLEELRRLTRPLGGTEEILALSPCKRIDMQGNVEVLPLGKALRIRKRPTAPRQIFFGGHMDTVFPPDSPSREPVEGKDNVLIGPGVADMKGGLQVMLAALETFEQTPWAEGVGWEILITPDEEIGSPGSAALLEESAGRNDLGLLYEPSLPDGGLIGERKGSLNLVALARGRTAHAGREHPLGCNAVRAMADFVRWVDDMNGTRKGVTVNPACIRGGGPVNMVPDLAVLRFNVRWSAPEDEAWLHGEMARAGRKIEQREGISLEITTASRRTPKTMDAAANRLFGMIEKCGEELGIKLGRHASGGCCDGNNLAAAGLPNVDTLGVRGGHTHTDREYVLLDSLTQRARLTLMFLMQLASGRLTWKPATHRRPT